MPLELKNLLETNTELLWAAVVSAVVSAGVSYYFKKREIRGKVEVEYEHEQRKKLRELIGRYHGSLLNAANSLNYRFWNLYSNKNKGWLKVDKNYRKAGYYFASSVYRFLNVSALVRQLEAEAIILDTRIAKPNDFTFLNYIAALHWVMTDAGLFKGFQYDDFTERDHFFSDRYRHYSELCWRTDRFITFDEFQSEMLKERKLEPVFRFFDSLNQTEPRLRWDRLVALHLILLAFINKFGYARQYSDQEHFNKVASQFRNPSILENLVAWLPKHDLDSDKEAKKIMKAARVVTSQN